MKLNYNSILLLLIPFVMVSGQSTTYLSGVKTIPNVTPLTATNTVTKTKTVSLKSLPLEFMKTERHKEENCIKVGKKIFQLQLPP